MDVGSIAIVGASGGGAGAQPRTPSLSSVKTLRQAAAVFFGQPSPRVLALHLLLLLLARLAYGRFGVGDLAVLLGVAVYWPFQEWVMHIYVLHMEPIRRGGRTIDPLVARLHRAHHREPWNLDYVFLPVSVLLPLMPINVLVWWLVTPSLGVALTGMMAMGAAALLYEWIHYLTHTPYRPRSGYYRRIWRGHRLHHFKNERYWHAFTAPAVDTLMGTNPDPRTVTTSPTCRDLDARG